MWTNCVGTVVALAKELVYIVQVLQTGPCDNLLYFRGSK